MSYDGVGPRAVMRSVAFLTAGALAVPLLTGCGSEDETSKPLAGQDIAPAARAQVTQGGTLRWAVDTVPETFNTFQSDADATTTRVAQAVLPSLYRIDENGRAQRNPAYLESAKVVDNEPKQVVLYKLNQQAVWSDGREIGAADFAAQWRALSGKDSAYWTARNAGYDRIEKIERGENDLEVRVTFARPYADWQSLFSPLYPKQVMGTPDSFNDGARRKLKVTAGPFVVKKVDRKNEQVRLARNPRWWGRPAKLSEIVLTAVPREKRAAALAAGKLDLAEIDPAAAQRIDSASAAKGAAGPRSVASGSSGAAEKKADDKPSEADKADKADKASKADKADTSLAGFEVRRSLEPAYTQLALNGADGPLADERVRRAVARALDRTELAALVLKPLGLPAVPVGSHLALSGQEAYADGSGALGGQDTAEAQALLADAGWVAGGPIKEETGEKAAGAKGEKSKDKKSDEKKEEKEEKKEKDKNEEDKNKDDDGTYIVGQDGKAPGETTGGKELAQDGKQQLTHPHQGGAPGAYAPKGTAAPAGAAAGALAKNGKALSLRFVLPSGPGSESLRQVAARISRMLAKVGIRTETVKVADDSYFKDHVASGSYDLALYSWPASAFPATDARPIYAKPQPAADGSLNVEQNYTRVGTDQVDQLFDQAISTLDEGEERDLIRKADTRIWAAAGSIPLYQRPQLTAARKNLANAGAFGFQTPVYEDMGFLEKGARPAAHPSGK
ncbi:ABC transporter family substrate-binding protein [Streptomyces antibioticus]|uniref:ABC transporter family substrate-binding protein n=1 Tax=Streptomyces antibioticus TaxID=1890 RepID=UPI00225B09C1|nr:ABC transporter family substrate-binding protein [Streptomyces antibioticus]MCX5171288.1 ABC transporter family substrate-binding protein [Streptomyces antibioticus]